MSNIKTIDENLLEQLWDKCLNTFMMRPNTNASTLEFLQNEYDKTLLQIWDEDWVLGALNPTTGALESGERVVSANYIPVESNTEYSVTSDDIGIIFFNSSKTAIANLEWYDSHFTTPTNAAYMKFHLPIGYGTYYRFDIMITKGPNIVQYTSPHGPIIHQSDIKPALLWENANPYTSYGENNPPISDSSTFKYLIIGAMINTSSVQAVQFFKIQNITGKTAYLSLTDNTSNNLYHRGLTITSNTQIGFQGGYINSSRNDVCCIPVRIYGSNI